MNIFLIANGKVNITLLQKLKRKIDPQIVIAVNGGTNKAVKAKIKPDIIIGDTDSLKLPSRIQKSTLNLIKKNIIKHPKDKDQSDLELAINFINSNYKNFTLFCFGVIGSRIDHSLSNIYSISKVERNFIVLTNQTMTILNSNRSIKNIVKSTKVSVISLNVPYSIVSMSGLKYSGTYEIPFLSSLGISNMTQSDENKIECKEGKIIVIIYRAFDKLNINFQEQLR